MCLYTLACKQATEYLPGMCDQYVCIGVQTHMIQCFGVDLSPLPVGADYIRGFSFFIRTLNTSFRTCLNIKPDINQQDLKIIDLHFVKSE